MKKSRILVAGLTAMMTLGVLSGCNASSASQPAETTKAATTEAAQESETTVKPETAVASDTVTAAGDALASKWPDSPVSLFVPAKAGGGTDVIARVYAQAMGDAADGNFVVVNDVTGGGVVPTENVRNSKPEGLDLLLSNTGLCGAITSGQYEHAISEFTMLGMVTTPSLETSGVFVSASSEFQTLEDLINYCKEKPGELLVGVQSNGASHYTSVLLGQQLGIDFMVVEAGSNADKITALMGGSIDVSVLGTVGTDQYVKSGDLRCLVITGAETSELIPGVPTMEERGYQTIDLPMCMFLLGAPDMNVDDIAKISETLKAACENQTLQENYKKLGVDWDYMTPEASSEFVQSIQKMYDEAYQAIK